MLQEVEEITPTTRKLKINIPSDVIEKEIMSAYNNLRTSVRIPGFRVGKVPQALLEKKFSRDVEAQVLERVIPEFYSRAIKEAEIIPVTYPEIEEIQLVRNQPLSFSVTVEVKPQIENLTFEGIVLKEKPISVDESEVESAIKALQEGRAFFNVSHGAVREEDMVIIDYDAFIDGNAVVELSKKDYPFIQGSESLPREFSDAMLGKKKGDTIELKINFDDTHPNKTIAGKEILFKVSIVEVKEKCVPALDEEFAKGFGCKDMEELRKKIYDDTYRRKKSRIDMEYKKELLNALSNSHDFEVPPSMVERELESLILEVGGNAIQRGEAPKGEDELREEYRAIARENMKRVLILEAIGKKEKIEVQDVDVNRAIEEIAMEYNLTPEEVKKIYIAREGTLQGLKNRLYTDKVLDFVLERAVIKKSSEL